MISDVLFQAIEDIRRYQRDQSFMYDDLEPEIRLVTSMMDVLRRLLDNHASGAGEDSFWEEIAAVYPNNRLYPENEKGT